MTAISSLEKIIHPTAATLFFPLQQEKQQSRAREWPEDIEIDHEVKKRKTNERSINFVNIENSDNKCDSSNDSVASEHIEIVIEEESDVSVEVVEVSSLQAKSNILEEKTNISSLNTINVTGNNTSEVKEQTISENEISINDCNTDKIHPLSQFYKNSSKNDANVTKDQTNGDIKANIDCSHATNDHRDLSENVDTDVSKMLIDFKDEVYNV